MAKASWLNVSPSSDSGNGTVNLSSVANHTGRTARTTTATFKASGVNDIPVTVNQAGKPEFVTLQSTATALKAGGNVTLSGTSNSSKLTFSLGSTGSLSITLPTTYTANSASTTNGTAVTGDPGASAQYNYSLVISVPENTTIEAMSKQIIVTDAGGNTATCTLTQAAGDPTLSLSSTTIDLTWEGTAVSVAVTSNTSWTVS